MVLSSGALVAASEVSARDPGGPSRSITVGQLHARIDQKKLWTLSGIESDGRIIAVEDSAYGTVINIKGVGFVGSAHQDHETESVTLVRYLLNGKPIDAPVTEMVGRSFCMQRQSTVHGIDLNSSLNLKDKQVFESVRIRSSRELALEKLYPAMYAWTPSASKYLFGGDGGLVIGGTFLTDPAKRQYIIEKHAVRWASVFDPKTRLGTVTRVLSSPPAGGLWLQFADCPGVYRKLYIMAFPEQTMPADFDGTYKVGTTIFETDELNWKQNAIAAALALQAAN